jgi:hypothetical protein
LVDPPVGTLGRPFIIFFLRGILGSSHDPARIAVAENSLTCWGVVADVFGAVGRRTVTDGRETRRGVAGDILSDWKALTSADEVVGLMAVELAGLGGLDGSGRVAFNRRKKTPAHSVPNSFWAAPEKLRSAKSKSGACCFQAPLNALQRVNSTRQITELIEAAVAWQWQASITAWLSKFHQQSKPAEPNDT